MKPLNLLVDTCFIIALVDESDAHHKDIDSIQKYFPECQFYIPWAVLFECLSERFYKSLNVIEKQKLLSFLFSEQTTLIDTDQHEKQKALKASINSTSYFKVISLTDCIILELLGNTIFKWDGLLSFNGRDFKYLCDIRQIAMLP